LRLFLDQNVPNSVATVFEEHGHEVIFLRDILPTDTPDQVVADVSETEGAILVTCDKDFKRIAPRIPLGQRQRFQRLSRISLDCPEPQAANRVRAAMSFVEAEYAIAQAANDPRMIVSIGKQVMRTHR
jgi:predicted nuclease of predicted toxin-antitoxin system